ncbi:hypothetical protein G6F57_013858 [Rhizopus arrhizus]|uniref:Uncharacterized protein n=1 Tax=Rhizopus oryzae TaxID=64495 RepID=A0A9P6XEZ0_RHIOR|nr:hypothetical protein G6F23_012038 [Rhizopus arrhizus]KAG1397021.1 hypothetical protein G6F58_011601 [Rhizopus delemar]KAG0753934.1 hypothetical protein G6F24_012712 [Rhizopus arrhizus]KAG0777069.1 hypothetical protein G6F22_012126 [Rhizopus arrhizus]KAG0779977.1 hypothetical protein G6F21_012348 [Rhizopus arrhizus]
MGQSHKLCPKKSIEFCACFTLDVKGHLSVHCTHAPPAEPKISKRSRHVASEFNTTSQAVAAPHGVKIPFLSCMLFYSENILKGVAISCHGV